MLKTQNISADFPYESNYVNVHGHEMHYIDEGSGDPILFLHGIPTSSYLWRNVIPWVTEHGRCIAPDLIGMGKSAKPDIPYRVFDFIKYVEGFIEALDLKNVTLVLHGWGSVIGLDYAMRNDKNIKGIVFIESYIKSEEGARELALPMQHIGSFLSDPEKAFDQVVNDNYFIDELLPSCVMRQLSEEEMAAYRAPFSKKEDRQLLWQFLMDLPFGGEKKDVTQLIEQYSQKLTQSQVPKLMLYAIPGYNTTVDTIVWARDNLQNLKLVDVGEDLHYIQESKPESVGKHIADWFCQLDQLEPVTV